jgi:anthranilate phosphoribosyltransferase
VSLTNNPKEFFQWLETATEGTLFSFISEWHTKGESSEELIKFIEFLREKAPPLSLSDLVYDENAGIGVCKQSPLGRVAKRTSSRLRRTNDRSVLQVHEDHEDDENAEIGVSLHAHLAYDCAGTGGDKSHSFNISTGTAFLAAYAGLPVIKNGGRSASSKVGSVDVLYEIGLDLDISEEKKLEAFQKLGLSFFSSKISSEYLLPVKNLARKYKESCFINLIAPFLSPIELQGQIIGIAQARWVPVIQEIARYFIKQGYRQKFILVHSSEEFSENPSQEPKDKNTELTSLVLDEFNTALPSKIIFISYNPHSNLSTENEPVHKSPAINLNAQQAYSEQEFILNPASKLFSELALTAAKLKDLEGGNTEENAQILIKIFTGESQAPSLKIKAETLTLNTALMLLLKEDFGLFHDEKSLVKELTRNYVELKKILETQNLYKFLGELRKYFTK